MTNARYTDDFLAQVKLFHKEMQSRKKHNHDKNHTIQDTANRFTLSFNQAKRVLYTMKTKKPLSEYKEPYYD
jgi:hypothetical protein|tara:strand:- start:4901 stop:5116 length:216 start_codon:yes stop_codon:yes gene_type:complete